jgi:replication-associated recombination protein RarA
MEQQKAEPKKPRAELFTRSGVRLDEATSSLQKSLRMAREDEALYWSIELIRSGFGGHCWRRIQACAWGDFGLADPTVPMFVTLAFVAVMNGSKSLRPHEIRMEPLGPAILRICRAPASRGADDATWLTEERIKRGWKVAVRDEALDQHCERGRQMGRRLAFWFSTASRLANHVEIEGDRYGRAVRELLMLPQETPPDDAPAS